MQYFDMVELHPCHMLNRKDVEQCTNDKCRLKHFYTVYLHYNNKQIEAGENPLMALIDFTEESAARKFSEQLAEQLGVKVLG